MASSAKGLQLTHHWGLSTGSMISPLLLYPHQHFFSLKKKHKPANWNLHLVILPTDIQPKLLQPLDNFYTGMKPLHTDPLPTAFFPRRTIGVQPPIVAKNRHHLQPMSPSDFPIVGIVCRGDFDGACSESHVDGFRVAYDGEATVWEERMTEEFPVEVGVAWIVWMDSDGCIAEHGFWTGGGDDDAFVCRWCEIS